MTTAEAHGPGCLPEWQNKRRYSLRPPARLGLYWDGSANGFAGEAVDGFEIAR
jgi:hypothetical protein